MEKKFYPPQQGDLKSLKSAHARKILQHVLSPLEEAAFKNDFRPFNYKVQDGTEIYVPHYSCIHLLSKTREKLDFMLNCSNKMTFFKYVPKKHWEASDDPAVILSLHPILRNKLCEVECYTLIEVLKRGRKYFTDLHFSPSHINTIQKLFEKYDCGNIF